MTRRRGRPPHKPPESQPQNPFEALYPPDRSQVSCILCREAVPDIGEHLKYQHPNVSLQEYRLQYPLAEIKGEPPSETIALQMPPVTAQEIANHPGGREGAQTEKLLERWERPAYRADVTALIEAGHEAGYQVAALAHLMTLGRRERLRIERVRETSRDEVIASEALDALHAIDGKIQSGIAALEKIRKTRLEEGGADPQQIVDSTAQRAEQWVQAHIGEFQERCPGCGEMLTAPALPHWAFEPYITERGEKMWPVWSPELWQLVVEDVIPLAVMAYVLRTSPEGLRYTARKRGLEWPESVNIEQAERELRRWLRADDAEFAQRGDG